MKAFGGAMLLLFSNLAVAQGNSCTSPYSLPLDGITRIFSVSATTGACEYCTMTGYSGNSGRITWFQFTTDNTAQCVLVNISTATPATMEVLLYDVCSAGNPQPVGGMTQHNMCMNNGSGYWAPSLFSNLSPNTNYYLRVRTENGYTGNLTVSGEYYTPVNDNCIGATSISLAAVSDNNSCHTPGPGVTPAQLCATTLENTAWYTYVVQNNGSSTITISNISCNNGNNNNTSGFQIGFFTGDCNSLTPLTCSSGTGGTVAATANGLTAGSQIFVAVDGYSGSNCSYNINASNSVALPIRLKNFMAKAEGAVNLLMWTTAWENNNSYFEIQRSEDGLQFLPIGRVAGQTQSDIETNYQFEDRSFTLKSFYRLKQVDLNGYISYSRVIKVLRQGARAFDVNVAGSANDFLRLAIHSSERRKIDLSVIDLSGVVRQHSTYIVEKGESTYFLPLDNLNFGHYFLLINADIAEKLTRKFFVTNLSK